MRTRFLYTSVFLSLATLVAIALNVPPFNGVSGDMLEFVRHYHFDRNWATVLIAVLLFWLAAKGKALLREERTPLRRRRLVVLVGGLLLTGLALQLQAQRLRSAAWLHWESPWAVGQLPMDGLEASAFRIADDWTGGYLNDAYAVHDVGWLLANYADATSRFHIHPHNKPPGGVLLMHSVLTAAEALPVSILRRSHRTLSAFPGLMSAVEVLESESGVRLPSGSRLSVERAISRDLAYPLVLVLVNLLLAVASTLAAVPLFLLAKELLGDAEQALWTSVAWLSLPGLLVLAPTFDQLYPLLSTVLLLAALWSRHVPYRLGPILVGMLLAFVLMFSPLFLTFVPVCAVLMVWPAASASDKRLSLITRGGLATLLIVASAGLVLALLRPATGFDYLAYFRTLGRAAGGGIDLDFAAQWPLFFDTSFRFHRPYIGAVLFNQYELVLTCGLVLFASAVYRTLVSLWSVFKRWTRVARLDLFVLGTTGALLFVSVSGRMDYEAVRISLPFLPFVLIASLDFLHGAIPDARKRHFALAALGSLQIVWMMVVREFMIIS